MQIERSVDIGRPRAEVFEFIHDPDNDPIWCPDVLSSRRIAGDGPVPGAEYEQVHDPGPGSPSELHVEITAMDPPSSMTVRSTDELGTFHVTYRLEELPGGRTRLTQHDDIRLDGAAKLLAPVMWLAVNSGIKKQFAELRRRLMADGDDADPSRSEPAE